MIVRPKISLGSWAFTYGPYEANPIPFDRTAQRLSQTGYDGIEIGGFEPHVTLSRYPDKASRAELKRLLDGLGLSVSGYAADFGTLAPTIAANRPAYLDLFARNLEMSTDLGAPSIRVDCVTVPGTFATVEDYSEAMHRMCDVWREAAAMAEEAGVLMVWEFEPAFVFNKPSEILRVAETVGHPNFRLMFDSSHAYMCAVVGARQFGERETLQGGVVGLLDMVAGYVGHIHLIDSDGELYEADTSTHVPFGLGFVNFEALAPKLLALPGIEWWCVDLCFWPGAWELVEPSLAFLRDIRERHLRDATLEGETEN
jgi:sugar phosphate isomerase/epimerase